MVFGRSKVFIETAFTEMCMPSVLCCAAVSWYGKTELRFLEGYYHSPESRKNKTVNQQVYCEEMCPQMFHDIGNVMDDKT